MKALRITLIATFLLTTFSLTSCTEQDLNENEGTLQDTNAHFRPETGGGVDQ